MRPEGLCKRKAEVTLILAAFSLAVMIYVNIKRDGYEAFFWGSVLLLVIWPTVMTLLSMNRLTVFGGLIGAVACLFIMRTVCQTFITYMMLYFAGTRRNGVPAGIVFILWILTGYLALQSIRRRVYREYVAPTRFKATPERVSPQKVVADPETIRTVTDFSQHNDNVKTLVDKAAKTRKNGKVLVDEASGNWLIDFFPVLKNRNDLTVEIRYPYLGQVVRTVIPAGCDCREYLGHVRETDYAKLIDHFGAKIDQKS